MPHKFFVRNCVAILKRSCLVQLVCRGKKSGLRRELKFREILFNLFVRLFEKLDEKVPGSLLFDEFLHILDLNQVIVIENHN